MICPVPARPIWRCCDAVSEWLHSARMTQEIAFEPATTRHPLRRALPASVARYAVANPARWRRDLRDFGVTFVVTFVTILTLFG